ncbi:LON peptidase substrate-binding domain-containing protein [Magnetospirillum molischianum]|uniref:Putative Lon family ATP-dependent protease n=1 Tax=Magnetospirillum molischianum DSM 120 TaxID=1150626 RepID=H8FTB9_MAGML|nr:LON peptidase substrate-binding domain-containing protein [Magnetospirillum molischianum]CCG41607.1 putative Lon family ATP-dependent protease [Magnetospirillum molischianum DSM 120]
MARAGLPPLPPVVPVFAVPGTILLPGGALPLIVFEARYLALIDDCLGEGRMLALVQPRTEPGGPVSGLYATGCVGRITTFVETGDGRYLITVTGMARFHLRGESEGRSGYRRVMADYSSFSSDLTDGDSAPIDRQPLLAVLRRYLTGHGMGADLAELEKADDTELTVRLAMACPFSPDEKQALLEAPDNAERCRLMTALIQKELLTECVSTSIH